MYSKSTLGIILYLSKLLYPLTRKCKDWREKGFVPQGGRWDIIRGCLSTDSAFFWQMKMWSWWHLVRGAAQPTVKMFTLWRLDGAVRPEYKSKTWASLIWQCQWCTPCRIPGSQGKLHKDLQPLPALGSHLASDKFLHPWLNKSVMIRGGGYGHFLQSIIYSNHCSWPWNCDLR